MGPDANGVLISTGHLLFRAFPLAMQSQGATPSLHVSSSGLPSPTAIEEASRISCSTRDGI
eukprot:1242285-Pyramimonas_sp.AAC.1